MQHSNLYPPVYVIGNGQLGRMLTYAGMPLDIAVYALDFTQNTVSLPDNAVITAEIERWPETALTEQLSSHSNFVNKRVFGRLADRLSQKQLLDKLQLATAKWLWLEDKTQWASIFQTVGEKVMVKRRTGGYDGRGQWVVSQQDPKTIEQLDDTLYQHTIVEAFMPFDYEVAIVGGRFADGSTYFYPLTRTFQYQGMLQCSLIDPYKPHALQNEAEAMLAAIMHELDYVGVMAMECFVVKGKLYINELAPRVHNSGHWTQQGANISQFELHLRALLNLSTPPLTAQSPCVMVNLVGIEFNPKWLAIPYSQLHWYGKEVRKGRKLGHINLCHSDKNILRMSLQSLFATLPADYAWGEQALLKHL